MEPTTPQELIVKATVFAKTYMSRFDGSHDFTHLKRVIGTAHHILSTLRDPSSPHYTPTALTLEDTTITLATLLHDVGDRKYLQPGEDAETMVRDHLLGSGASRELAEKVQAICTGVSWTGEMRNRVKAKELLALYPELAVVQDADRLDAIGAVGIGRVFTFGGAKTLRGMDGSVEMFDEKLLSIEGRMKTAVGKELARVYTERLKVFRGWWDEEVGMESKALEVLGGAGIDKEILTVVKVIQPGFQVGLRERIASGQ